MGPTPTAKFVVTVKPVSDSADTRIHVTTLLIRIRLLW